MKKIVIFGGGSGLSQILNGLKLFPLDITAVVSMSDNGSSTGKLREDFNIVAVGDITKVLMSMSNAPEEVNDLFNYRFECSKSIDGHSIKNLLLAALLDMKGNVKDSLKLLTKLLDVKGRILPLTEDSVDLIGLTESGKKIIGEEQITTSPDKIVDIMYSGDVEVNCDVIDAIYDADLIIFSSGSLLTSIMPHIIVPSIVDAINNTKAEKMYICNLVSQQGETNGFTVTDHLKMLNKHLGKSSIDVVLANNGDIDECVKTKYLSKEQKEQVIIDYENIKNMNVKLIADDIIDKENDFVRHNSLKTAYLIFSYLMDGD